VLRSRDEVNVIPIARVERLDVSRGRRPATAGALRGMGIGFLAGAVAALREEV
jgi:hypothetical protein